VTRFVVRRLGVAVLQVLLVTFIAYMLFFVISSLTGADPAQRVAGKGATPDQVARIAALLGTDRPWYEQYARFLVGVLHGDFGYSFQQRLPVSELLFPAAFVTSSLVIGAAIIWMLVAIPVGLIGALRPRSVADRVSAVIIQIAIAHIAFSISYVAVIVRSRALSLDPRMEEAARDLGASAREAFAHVTLPLIASAVAAGALMSFALSFDDLIITSFNAGVGSSTLPLYIYSRIKFGVTPEINAISTIVVTVTAVGILASTLYISRRNRLSLVTEPEELT